MKRRETREKRRRILLIGAMLLAAPIGGMIGIIMQPNVDETTERKLQTSPESQLQMRLRLLAETGDSPERVESGDLCYYAALHHATGHHLELSLLFLDALERRFPDSPFVQKVETLRPLIETARKKEESPQAAAAAQARLTIMALPLAVGVNPKISSSSRPWWHSLPAGNVVMASPESKYAGWPIRYTGKTGEESPWNRQRMNRRMDGDWYAIRGFETLPIQTLTASRTATVPVLREFLDDPRLTGLPLDVFLFSHYDPKRPWYFSIVGPHEPRLLWRVCYEVLCYAAGFHFAEIEYDPAIERPYMQHPDFTLTPKVRAYIDRWFDECLEMSARESILWHFRQIDLRSRAMGFHASRLVRAGPRDDVLKVLHERVDPDDPEIALLLARMATNYGDDSLIAVPARHLVEGRSPDVDETLRFVARHGMAEDKSLVLAHLQALPVPSSYNEKMERLQHLAVFGDTSRVTDRLGLFERLPDGSLSDYKRCRNVVWLVTQQNRPECNRIVVKECLATLSKLSPPMKTVKPNKDRDSITACQLWRICSSLVMENSFTDEQKARLYGAFLDWPAGEKEHIVSAMGKITAIAERICDGAAYYLIEWGLASSEFDMDAPEPERDKQIEIIREEIRKRYPAATEPTRTKEISG